MKIRGRPMWICARCTGFYAGIIIGVVFNFFFRFLVDMPWWAILMMVFIGLAPMALDGFTQLRGMRESNNPLRLITGLMGGFACGLIIIYLGVSIAMMAGGPPPAENPG